MKASAVFDRFIRQWRNRTEIQNKLITLGSGTASIEILSIANGSPIRNGTRVTGSGVKLRDTLEEVAVYKKLKLFQLLSVGAASIRKIS
jgi:hypothetical protein